MGSVNIRRRNIEYVRTPNTSWKAHVLYKQMFEYNEIRSNDALQREKQNGQCLICADYSVSGIQLSNKHLAIAIFSNTTHKFDDLLTAHLLMWLWTRTFGFWIFNQKKNTEFCSNVMDWNTHKKQKKKKINEWRKRLSGSLIESSISFYSIEATKWISVVRRLQINS